MALESLESILVLTKTEKQRRRIGLDIILVYNFNIYIYIYDYVQYKSFKKKCVNLHHSVCVSDFLMIVFNCMNDEKEEEISVRESWSYCTTLQVQSKDFDFQHMELLHNGRKIQISLTTSLLKTSF